MLVASRMALRLPASLQFSCRQASSFYLPPLTRLVVATAFGRLILVVAVVLALLLAYSFTSGSRQVRSEADATAIVFDDLNSDSVVSQSERIYDVFSTTRDSPGQWRVIVKVTLDPYTPCPRAFIRTYELLPIRHGVDKTIASDCVAGSPIAFPEEAIIASKDVPAVKALGTPSKVCGYELPLSEEKARKYCTDSDLDELRAFATSRAKDAKWLTEWRAGDTRILIAIDGQGNVLATR